jgi:Fic family protein
MPKRIPETELDEIVAAVAVFPSGASIDDVVGAIDSALPRRTMQRRLTLLVDQNRLVRLGRGPATRYLLRSPKIDIQAETGKLAIEGYPPTVETYVPISEESESIRDAVRQPIQKRQPVGYNRSFLDGYRPNETYYLPSDVRARLLELGKSTNGDLPAGTYARRILNRLLIDLSWNSSRLEGNTYSLLETERLLELGEAAAGKDAREAQMILNHKSAIEMLVEYSDEVGFNRFTILNLHALLSENLLPDASACGRLRRISVGIGGTVFHPLDVPQLIEECFQQILDTAAAISDPFEQSLFVMVHMPYLQPFEDVNKRVSRLAANLPFIRRNLSPLSFVDVPERAYVDAILAVYELNRVELLRDVYVWAYERSCARYSAVRQSIGEPDPFRLRYREVIGRTIAEVVRSKMNKMAANAYIEQQATEELPEKDQARFKEVAATELQTLHEGNIARYRLRPSEYRDWLNDWA